LLPSLIERIILFANPKSPKSLVLRVKGPEKLVRSCSIVVLVLFCSSLLVAQQILTNDSVIKLAKAGLSDDLLVSTINASPGKFDVTADGLIALKRGGISDKVVSAILLKSFGNAPSSQLDQASDLHPAITQSPSARSESAATSPEAVLTTRPRSPETRTTRPPDISEPGSASGWARVPPGARVVIAPMGGFETYFAAAVREKKVPIALTLDKASAQYFVISTNTEWEGFVYGSGGTANWSKAGGNASYGSAASSTRGLEASIMIIDAKSKDVVWAYEVHKNSHGALIFGTFGARGQQSIAEACAKHLKEFIEKGK